MSRAAMESANVDGAVLDDRRRPGRTDVHPSLIPLLRGQFSGASDDVPGQAGSILLERRDDLAAVVGIARGVFAVCAVVAVAYVVY